MDPLLSHMISLKETLTTETDKQDMEEAIKYYKDLLSSNDKVKIIDKQNLLHEQAGFYLTELAVNSETLLGINDSITSAEEFEKRVNNEIENLNVISKMLRIMSKTNEHRQIWFKYMMPILKMKVNAGRMHKWIKTMKENMITKQTAMRMDGAPMAVGKARQDKNKHRLGSTLELDAPAADERLEELLTELEAEEEAVAVVDAFMIEERIKEEAAKRIKEDEDLARALQELKEDYSIHGGKSRKQKSRKQKSRKQKSRKQKSRKQKSRKQKYRKQKSRKQKYRKQKSRKQKSRKQKYRK